MFEVYKKQLKKITIFKIIKQKSMKNIIYTRLKNKINGATDLEIVAFVLAVSICCKYVSTIQEVLTTCLDTVIQEVQYF